MELIFLGTGTSQGIPVIGCSCEVCQSQDEKDKRLRTSAALVHNGGVWVIDVGPDFRQQMLREGITHLEGILLTHAHRDHVGGLDDIRPYNYLCKKIMPVYGDAATLRQVREDFSYIFTEVSYPGLPLVDLRVIEAYKAFSLGDLEITPFWVLHHKLPVMGFRAGQWAYVTDASEIPSLSWEVLEGVRVLIINALRKEPHFSHFHLAAAVEIAQKLGVEEAYFIHISHWMGRHEEVQRELPKGMFLAYDGLRLKL
ncbi:MAG: MBL fold metallo-hydrolase [Bacteroidia bacterium]